MNSPPPSLRRPGLTGAGSLHRFLTVAFSFVAVAGWAASPPAPSTPAEAVAELRTAIAQGDVAGVELLVTTFAPLLVAALDAPDQAGTIAAVLRSANTANPASSARIADAIATLAGSLPADTSNGAAQSASVLAVAVSTVISAPAVIAAAPSTVANAARTVSGVASSTSVINANPAVAAQIARDTAAVARNPAVLRAAPAVAGAIAANVSIIVTNPAVRAAAPVLASLAAADITAVIHNETVTSSSRESVTTVETNFGLSPVTGINPSLNVSPSGG